MTLYQSVRYILEFVITVIAITKYDYDLFNNFSNDFFSGHVTSQMDFTKALNRLGESAIMREDEPDDIGAAFQKFAVVTKELALLMKNLVSR